MRMVTSPSAQFSRSRKNTVSISETLILNTTRKGSRKNDSRKNMGTPIRVREPQRARAFADMDQRVRTTMSAPSHQTQTVSPLARGSPAWRAALVWVTLSTRPEARRTW